MQSEYLRWNLVASRVGNFVEVCFFPCCEFNRCLWSSPYISSWNIFILLEVWMSFLLEYTYMLFSLCREARRSKLLRIHLGWTSNHISSILSSRCLWGNLLHSLIALLWWRFVPLLPLPRSGLIVLQTVVIRRSNALCVTWGSDS